MKKIIKSFLTLGLCCILFISCKLDDSNDNSDLIIADKFNSLDEVKAALAPTPQEFVINDPTILNTFTGIEGIKIDIYPNAFTDALGNTITQPVKAHLTEYLSIEAITLGGLQTVSNGDLLVTGGSFNITFTDMTGNHVNANPYFLSGSIPIKTNITGYEQQLQYFTGEMISTTSGRDIINWQTANNGEAFILEENGQLMFYLYGILPGLGNIDMFYNSGASSLTAFDVTLLNDDFNIQTTAIFLVIDDIPSVFELYTPKQNNSFYGVTTGNHIPVGTTGHVIAFRVNQNNNLEFGSVPITVEGNDIFTFEMEPGTLEELEDLIHTITI